MFQGWYNPGTNKFQYGLNPKHAWYNMMGEEIGHGFTISNFQAKNQANLTLDETREGLHLKDDVAFALLTTIICKVLQLKNELDDWIWSIILKY
jgi:hypothetical protein